MTSWMLTITGWTLIHFTWQGASIAFVVAFALRLAQRRSASARYAIACAGLCAMLAAPIVTAKLIATGAADAAAESGQVHAVFPIAAGCSGGACSGETAFVRASDSSRSGRIEQARPLLTTLSVNAIEFGRVVPALTIVWLAGVLLLLARLCGGWWYVHQLHRTALASPASPWQGAGERIARRLGLSAVVRVVESTAIDVPAVVGWLRPAIVLPIAALAALTPAQVEAILAHELAHIARHDYVVNLLQTLAETLLFYHPAVWWLSHRIRVEREHCCDDVAVAVCGDPLGYAQALADIEAGRSCSPALAVAATGGSLVDRIARILRVPRDDARSPRWAATLILTLLFTAGAGSIERLPKLRAAANAQTASARPEQPPAGSYVIGAQDRLKILVVNEAALTGTFLVDGDGTISYPYLH
ncbi:MAG TPA: M56 family metallopeptidase, partial [Vicinamibacterales bacterium]